MSEQRSPESLAALSRILSLARGGNLHAAVYEYKSTAGLLGPEAERVRAYLAAEALRAALEEGRRGWEEYVRLLEELGEHALAALARALRLKDWDALNRLLREERASLARFLEEEWLRAAAAAAALNDFAERWNSIIARLKAGTISPEEAARELLRLYSECAPNLPPEVRDTAKGLVEDAAASLFAAAYASQIAGAAAVAAERVWSSVEEAVSALLGGDRGAAAALIEAWRRGELEELAFTVEGRQLTPEQVAKLREELEAGLRDLRYLYSLIGSGERGLRAFAWRAGVLAERPQLSPEEEEALNRVSPATAKEIAVMILSELASEGELTGGLAELAAQLGAAPELVKRSGEVRAAVERVLDALNSDDVSSFLNAISPKQEGEPEKPLEELEVLAQRARSKLLSVGQDVKMLEELSKREGLHPELRKLLEKSLLPFCTSILTTAEQVLEQAALQKELRAAGERRDVTKLREIAARNVPVVSEYAALAADTIELESRAAELQEKLSSVLGFIEREGLYAPYPGGRRASGLRLEVPMPFFGDILPLILRGREAIGERPWAADVLLQLLAGFDSLAADARALAQRYRSFVERYSGSLKDAKAIEAVADGLEKFAGELLTQREQVVKGLSEADARLDRLIAAARGVWAKLDEAAKLVDEGAALLREGRPAWEQVRRLEAIAAELKAAKDLINVEAVVGAVRRAAEALRNGSTLVEAGNAFSAEDVDAILKLAAALRNAGASLEAAGDLPIGLAYLRSRLSQLFSQAAAHLSAEVSVEEIARRVNEGAQSATDEQLLSAAGEIAAHRARLASADPGNPAIPALEALERSLRERVAARKKLATLRERLEAAISEGAGVEGVAAELEQLASLPYPEVASPAADALQRARAFLSIASRLPELEKTLSEGSLEELSRVEVELAGLIGSARQQGFGRLAERGEKLHAAVRARRGELVYQTFFKPIEDELAKVDPKAGAAALAKIGQLRGVVQAKLQEVGRQGLPVPGAVVSTLLARMAALEEEARRAEEGERRGGLSRTLEGLEEAISRADSLDELAALERQLTAAAGEARSQGFSDLEERARRLADLLRARKLDLVYQTFIRPVEDELGRVDPREGQAALARVAQLRSRLLSALQEVGRRGLLVPPERVAQLMERFASMEREAQRWQQYDALSQRLAGIGAALQRADLNQLAELERQLANLISEAKSQGFSDLEERGRNLLDAVAERRATLLYEAHLKPVEEGLATVNPKHGASAVARLLELRKHLDTAKQQLGGLLSDRVKQLESQVASLLQQACGEAAAQITEGAAAHRSAAQELYELVKRSHPVPQRQPARFLTLEEAEELNPIAGLENRLTTLRQLASTARRLRDQTGDARLGEAAKAAEAAAAQVEAWLGWSRRSLSPENPEYYERVFYAKGARAAVEEARGRWAAGVERQRAAIQAWWRSFAQQVSGALRLPEDEVWRYVVGERSALDAAATAETASKATATATATPAAGSSAAGGAPRRGAAEILLV